MFGNSSFDSPGTGRSLQTISGHKQMFASTLSSFGGSGYNNNFKVRRSTSGSCRNTLGKLDNIKQKLSYLESDIKNTRENTKESKLYLKFMKDDLAERNFKQLQKNLNENIKILKKSLQISQRSDKLRYQGIMKTISQLKKNSNSIKDHQHRLGDRIASIQETLGFYSGAQKHK